MSCAYLFVLLSRLQGENASATNFGVVKDVIQDVSRQLGEPVRVSPSLECLPIVYRRGNATAQSFIEAVASSLHASVAHGQSGWEIRRSPTDELALKAEDEKTNEQLIKSIITRMEATAKGVERFGSLSSQINELILEADDAEKLMLADPQGNHPIMQSPNEVSPAAKLMLTTIANLGLKELASIRPGESRDYSNQPTPAQLPIHSFEASLEAFCHQQDELVGTGVGKRIGALPTGLAPDNHDQLKFLLKEDCIRGRISFELHVYDLTGKRIAKTFANSLASYIYPSSTKMIRQTMSTLNSHWVGISSFSQSQVSLARVGMRPDMETRSQPWVRADGKGLIPAKLPAFFLRPDKNDPDAGIVTDGFEAVALSKNSNSFVAEATDEIFPLAFDCISAGRINGEAFDMLLASFGHYEELQSAGFLIMRPKQPIDAEAKIVDRKALSRLVSRTTKRGRIDFREWCISSFELGEGADSPVALWFEAGLRRCGYEEFHEISAIRTEFLRMIGSLSDEAWLSLNSKESIDCTSSPLNVLATRLLFSAYEPLRWNSPHPDIYSNASQVSTVRSADGCTLNLSITSNPLISEYRNGKLNGDEQTIGEYAGQLFLFVNMGRKEPVISQADVVNFVTSSNRTFKVGSRLTVKVKLALPSGGYQSFSAWEDDPGQEIVTYADLSDATKQALWESCLAEQKYQKEHPPIAGGQPKRIPFYVLPP